MIRLEFGYESDMVEKLLKVCMIEDKTAVVVVASYRSVSRNPRSFQDLFVQICNRSSTTHPTIENFFVIFTNEVPNLNV